MAPTLSMYHKRNHGFTLIELLIVVAIIGVLSAVVLASLTTARTKGSDAAAKQDLLGPRSQGELFYYANGNSYKSPLDVCGATPAPGNVKSINGQVLAAAQSEGIGAVTQGAITSQTVVACNSTATAWAAEVPLKVPANSYFCVDSTGLSVTSVGTPAITTTSDVSCL